MRRVLPAFLLLLPLCASLRLGGEVFCHYDDQGRRQFEDRYDYYDYDTDGGHTGYGTIGGNYSGTYYSYNEPVTVKLHDGVSPVRAYTLTASSTGNTGNLSVPAEDWLRGSDWGGGIGGILYSQVEFGNATTASYYHYDGRGDVVALTSNTGNVTYAAAYNAYGTHAVSLNATTNVTITGTQEVGTDLDPFRTNTREEWDSADGTAFVKEGHRIRGLETDTYLTRDPLGQAAGTNYYTYVLQDEWTKFDPLGLAPPGTLSPPTTGWDTPETLPVEHPELLPEAAPEAGGIIEAVPPVAAVAGTAGLSLIAGHGYDILPTVVGGQPISTYLGNGIAYALGYRNSSPAPTPEQLKALQDQMQKNQGFGASSKDDKEKSTQAAGGGAGTPPTKKGPPAAGAAGDDEAPKDDILQSALKGDLSAGGDEYKPTNREQSRTNSGADSNMGGEDNDAFDGKGYKKGTPEYEKARRDLEESKRQSGRGGKDNVDPNDPNL